MTVHPPRALAAASAGLVLLAHPAAAQRAADLLLRGGTVVDGTGAAPRTADVAIRGDRVVFVGDARRAGLRAARTVDARGLVVAPGFIDPHAHVLDDLSDSATASAPRRANLPYLMQGVTTTITGNDGGGPTGVEGVLARWDRQGLGTNAALLVGQGTVRRRVMGMRDAAPTPAELDSMRALVSRAMDGGALGLSTGLYYAPGSWSSTEEVIALAREAGARGGVYDSHLRDESSYTVGLLGAVDEALRIGREGHVPVHISHVKALGADVWGRSAEVIARVRRAREAGQDVTADQYPYTASGSSVGASLLPRWAEAGGRDSLARRAGDPATRTRLLADMRENLRRRGGPAALLITSTPDATLRGRTLAQVAEARGAEPVAAALDIVLGGDAGVASFNMKDADLDAFAREPWVATGSDGSAGHPRKYGTFPRAFRRNVEERRLMTLAEFVRRSSAATARTFHLDGRGVLAPGAYADVIAFDPRTFADRATYERPEELAVGMRWVLVNGRVAVAGGRFTGALAGRALRRGGSPAALTHESEVRRTAHGVPHIRAENLAAAGYALGYVQSEDYGARVAWGLVRTRGELGRWFGRDSLAGDFPARLAYARAVAGYPTLDRDVRDVYDGFAAGVTRYVALHAAEFPAGFAPRFTGYDVLAHEVTVAGAEQAARFLARRGGRAPNATAPNAAASEGEDPAEEGSNAWALAPGRTTRGRAILLRNPHLGWTSGYYEAHVAVPGVLDFYGDFRVGGPFTVVGGFNRDLGWATTNNDPLLAQVYALDADPARADHYLLDGASLPLQRETVTVEYRSADPLAGDGLARETRETWRTSLGPVVARDSGRVYVLRAAADGEVRGGEQFLRMMRAHSLAEWKDAMRMRARVNSSFTYADRAGHIFYVWNADVPALPLPSGGDTTAVPARRTADVWTRYVAFDSLPQVLDPPGGYVHNENDPPYYTNLRRPLDRAAYPPYFPEPRLGLRSQLALQLVGGRERLSLEDVVARKHSYRMLLADRARDALVAAVRAASPTPEVARAAEFLSHWDKTAAPASRGGVLFEGWWRRYVAGARPDTMYAEPWSPAAPTATPRGLRFPARAVEAFAWAVDETARRYGRWDVAWGDVHRVRVGAVDVPVGGCNGDLGCFRVLWYKDDPDGRREAVGGDGWVLAVEFGEQPRAYSVLAYGESPRAESPYHSDQAAMFARGELKPVLWREQEIRAQTVRWYRPGQ